MIVIRYIVLFILINTTIYSQIVTDRPSESTSIYVLKPNTFQIETGLQLDNISQSFQGFNSNGSSVGRITISDYYISYPQLLLRFGMTKDFEIRASLSRSELIDGIISDSQNDYSLGFKFRIIEGDVSAGMIFTFIKNQVNGDWGNSNLDFNFPIDINLANNFSITSNSKFTYSYTNINDGRTLQQIILLAKSLESNSSYIETNSAYIESSYSNFQTTGIMGNEIIINELIANAGYQLVINNMAVDFRVGFAVYLDVDYNRPFANIGFSYLID